MRALNLDLYQLKKQKDKKEGTDQVYEPQISPLPTFLPHLFSNTATYHQMREPVRSSNTADPIVDHTPSPCSDTHTARIAGIEMDTRSESTSIARLV